MGLVTVVSLKLIAARLTRTRVPFDKGQPLTSVSWRVIRTTLGTGVS